MIGEIYTFKNEYFLHITNNTNMVNIFLQEILKIGFSWYIIGIIFPIVENISGRNFSKKGSLPIEIHIFSIGVLF